MVKLNHPHSVRINSLDGLRGLAILAVVLYHGFSRWPDFMPWVTDVVFSNFWKYGYLGVDLFFMISGFVIFMTLERSGSFVEFILKRWLRLFPAMLIASGLLFLTGPYLQPRPLGIPAATDLIPGLLLIDHNLINFFFDTQLKSIEGPFWSLYVEVKFYFLFGMMYFFARKYAIAVLLLCFSVFVVLFLLVYVKPSVIDMNQLKAFDSYFSFRYFGLFAAGACFYRFLNDCGSSFLLWFVLLFPLNALAALGGRVSVVGVFVFALFYGAFALALSSGWFSRVFESKFLLFFGRISYTLYLLHEGLMVAFTVLVKESFAFIPDVLTPLPGLLLIIIASYWITMLLEEPIKTTLRAVLMRSGFLKVM